VSTCTLKDKQRLKLKLMMMKKKILKKKQSDKQQFLKKEKQKRKLMIRGINLMASLIRMEKDLMMKV